MGRAEQPADHARRHRQEEDGGEIFIVIDAIREWKPKFSPEAVVAEASALLKSYRISSVTGDRYAGEWPREAFQRYGIRYEPSASPKSDLYRDALPLINSGQIELLDDPRVIGQIVGLERRTGRGGRDSIDHAPGAWFREPVREMTVFAEQYDFAISLLLLDDEAPFGWFDEEAEPDTYDRFGPVARRREW